MSVTLQQLNWIDYAVIVIVGFSTIMSFFRGFVREVISLVAWLLGLIISLKYAVVAQKYLAPWVAVESVRYFISFVALFLSTVIVGLLINWLVSVLMAKAGLSFTDRLIGVFFGAARGAIVVAVILLMIAHLGTVRDSVALRESQLSPQFKPMVVWLNGFLPDTMQTVIEWVEVDTTTHSS